MSDKANWVGTTEVDDTVVQHQETHRFLGGSKFVIADPTDSTKTMVFNLSGLTTGTETEFTVPESDSSIVTLSATQTLTNKTLTTPTLNGGTWVATDSTFTIADNATPTKIANFQCSGLSAGTNVFTFPQTAADTLVCLATTQTLTNKTLTAPTINAATLTGAISGGTFDTSTLTAPTINAATLTGTISGGTFTSSTLTSPTINGGSFNRTAQVYFVTAPGNAKVGATAGWTIAAASDTSRVTMAAGGTASTLVIPIVAALKVGWTITGFYLVGQIESAGNVCTLDANMFKLTAAAADLTDASIGAITQISVTADTEISAANSTKTLVTPEVIAANESFYVLITGTTAASTDIDLMGVAVIVTEV